MNAEQKEMNAKTADKDGHKSCEFANQSTYCVNKATYQLNQLHESLLHFQEKFIGHRDEMKNEPELKLIKFDESKTVNLELEAFHTGTELEVFPNEVVKLQSKESNLFQLSVEPKEGITTMTEDQIVMLNNIKSLIFRMDENITKLQSLLEQEKSRTNMLREKIDSHAYKRIHNLTMAVQKEHEKCAYDVQELKWHCGYHGRIEQRIKEKVRQADNINKKILEGLEFVQESSPLVMEKQEHEKESMKDIQQKQNITDIQLKKECEKLKDTEEKFELFKKRAEQEEQFLAERVLSLSNELTSTLEQFLKSQNQHDDMVKTIEDTEKKLVEEQLKAKSLEKSLKDVQEKQKDLEEELEILNASILDGTLEYKRLVEENEVFLQKKIEKELSLDTMTKTLKLTIRKKTAELQTLLKTNGDSQKEIRNLRKRLEISEKQKVANMKSLQRAMEEREKVLSDLRLIREEINQAFMIQEKLMLVLEQESDRVIKIEENLKMQAENLNKQNTEENHARLVLQARIKVDTANFEKSKKEAEKKKEKLSKAKQDVDVVVSTVNAQVERLEEKYNERIGVSKELNNVINQLSEKYNELEKTLTGKINELESKEMDLKEELADLGSKEKEMDSTSTLLDKKLKDMASSSIVMKKLLLSHQVVVEELNEELSELQIQLDSGRGLENTLHRSLNEVHERTKLQKTKHKLQMDARRKTLADIQEQVSDSLKENSKLAPSYVDLQNKHIDQKNRFLTAYEKSLIAQEDLADKGSLCELHSRLHEALNCYYQLRGMQTKAGLSRFEQINQKNNKKLIEVQDGLEVATSNVSAFLAATNNSHKFLNLEHKVGNN